MTWRQRSGVITVGGERAHEIIEFLDARAILAVVETHDAAYESLHLRFAVDADGGVAGIDAEAGIHQVGALGVIAQELADHVGAEVSFADEAWVPSGADRMSGDPFEQPLGADIASFVERAAVFTRAPLRVREDIAAQVEDVIYELEHRDGHALLITEGPVLATLRWEAEALPALIFEDRGDTPALTVLPAAGSNAEALTHVWGAATQTTPTGDLGSVATDRSAHAFIDTVLGTGAFVRELMITLPAIEPNAARSALAQGMPELLLALDLPAGVGEYLGGAVAAADLDAATEVHPASFARSVRRVVTEASTSVSERAEAMRTRAVAVRTRAETAFDAAEAFAEDVVIPVRQNWVSPALAVAETTLGVLALGKARRSRGVVGGVLGTAAAVLLADAVVNTVISIAPVLRRQR